MFINFQLYLLVFSNAVLAEMDHPSEGASPLQASLIKLPSLRSLSWQFARAMLPGSSRFGRR